MAQNKSYKELMELQGQSGGTQQGAGTQSSNQMLDLILNRKPFQYNAQTDPAAQAARKTAARNAQAGLPADTVNDLKYQYGSNLPEDVYEQVKAQYGEDALIAAGFTKKVEQKKPSGGGGGSSPGNGRDRVNMMI